MGQGETTKSLPLACPVRKKPYFLFGPSCFSHQSLKVEIAPWRACSLGKIIEKIRR